ncbi:MAG: radical SAM protein [Coriobacteriales bacterium]|nr:radical SAM protein [Coriobacteriales bacterium]
MIAGNIMLTGACNLSCPYCFSDEFSCERQSDISQENFQKAVDFIVGKGNAYHHVGIIGGEPTTHPDFCALMRQLVEDERIEDVDLFTNGLLIDRFINVLSNKKFHMLINVNSPDAIGQTNYRRLRNNIGLVRERCDWNHIGLGINLFGENADYGFMLDLIDRYPTDSIRVSVTVPDVKRRENQDAFAFFERMKPVTLYFCREVFDRGVVPFFDCNKIPFCLLMDDEKEFCSRYKANPKGWKALHTSNLFNGLNRCEPSIVIGQDLVAARCFGLSSTTKVNIADFDGMGALADYYVRTIDADAYTMPLRPECNECDKRSEGKCMGGCLVFRSVPEGIRGHNQKGG